jgi:hypothetical protein
MTERWQGWCAWHPEEGFEEGMGADGGGMLRTYDELDSELVDAIKELNEDDPEKKWRAVKVVVTAEDWDPPVNVPFGGPFND